MFAPITQALIEDAAIGRQDSVLDVATGPGEPTLSVTALVGPDGKVFGVDAIHSMVTAARAEANRLGLKNTKFDAAFADDLPFAADTFDAVISRLGVMFFPSPVDSIGEILRVLKPGRKLALAVGHFARKKSFPLGIVTRYGSLCGFAAT
jgi:ubiquinone/menaquinone biosynthesis C-methylase UbiE